MPEEDKRKLKEQQKKTITKQRKYHYKKVFCII